MQAQSKTKISKLHTILIKSSWPTCHRIETNSSCYFKMKTTGLFILVLGLASNRGVKAFGRQHQVREVSVTSFVSFMCSAITYLFLHSLQSRVAGAQIAKRAWMLPYKVPTVLYVPGTWGTVLVPGTYLPRTNLVHAYLVPTSYIPT
jgi:hypothetical protein